MGSKLYHGASWYPELWNRDVRNEDIRLMKEAGINVVRIGEFAWSTYEPFEGSIDISFFAEVIEELYRNGIETVVSTPTPTPPIWMSHNHPERLHVDHEGRIMGHGSRQHMCTNNPYFREKTARIVRHLAAAVSHLPGVIAWQIDNELKSHVSECFCPTCRTLWHRWLEQRYGTIDRLNDAWGTTVWSEAYQTFDQVPQPGPTPFLHNSSLLTTHQLFSMEHIAEFVDMQAGIIREYSQAPITHNSSVAFHVDNERLFRNLDFASYDTYASYDNKGAYLLNCDLWRNIKQGRSFWVMETSTSHAGSIKGHSQMHPAGYLKAEAAAAYALGAEGFCYWLWRQQRSGSEQPHGAVLSAWGKPTVGFNQVLEVEAVRQEMEPVILASRPLQAQVAITYSDRAKAFLRTEPHKNLNHRGLTGSYYERLLQLNLHRDLIPEGGHLHGYRLLLTPFLHYLSPDLTRRAMKLVEEGGIWIAGPLTGGRTEEHTIHTDAALGELERLAGVETVYTYPMDGSGSMGSAFGHTAPLSLWSAVFKTREARAVGIVEQGPTPGLAFLTECVRGKGKIVMLGSMPAGEEGDRLLKSMLLHYADEAGVTVRSDATPGTIVAPRLHEDDLLWVMVNMDGHGGRVTLPLDGIDTVDGRIVPAGALEVEPFQQRMILMPKQK